MQHLQLVVWGYSCYPWPQMVEVLEVLEVVVAVEVRHMAPELVKTH